MAEHAPKRSAARKFSPSRDVFKGLRANSFTAFVKADRNRAWSKSEGGPAQQPGPKTRGE